MKLGTLLLTKEGSHKVPLRGGTPVRALISSRP
jgi:hypothetical protein